MTDAAEFHEVANLFPLMEEQALADLAADIAANGLREPIWRHADGRIIDGRNRWLACRRAGVQCHAHAFEGDDRGLLAFVISANLHRRHLTESQRAVVAGKIANMDSGFHGNQHLRVSSSDETQINRATAAQLLNVSTASVTRARRVLRDATPEVVAAVESGELSVSAAAKLSGYQSAEQRKRLDAHRSTGGTDKRGPGKGTPKMKSLPEPRGRTPLRVAFSRDDGLVEQVFGLISRLREVSEKTSPEALHGRIEERLMHNISRSIEPATEFLIGLRNAHRARDAEKKNAAV